MNKKIEMIEFINSFIYIPSDRKNDLINKVETNQIKNMYFLKKEMGKDIIYNEEEKKKNRKQTKPLKRILDESNIDFLSKHMLIGKINNNEITTEDELINAIKDKKILREEVKKSRQIEKIEERRKRYIKEKGLIDIVDKMKISQSFKIDLYKRIKDNTISNEESLKRVIKKRKEIEMQIKLNEYVDNTDLPSYSKEYLKDKIKLNEISNEKILKFSINREKKESRGLWSSRNRKKYVNSTSVSNTRGHRPYNEIADDICYNEDFDGWQDDGNGISFYRQGTGMYSSKYAHYSYDELEDYDRF